MGWIFSVFLAYSSLWAQTGAVPLETAGYICKTSTGNVHTSNTRTIQLGSFECDPALTATPTQTVVIVVPTATQAPGAPTASPTITPTPLATQPPITPAVGNGIWISTAEISSRPTTGQEWSTMLSIAQSASAIGANISDQNSTHDTDTLAMALVCVRLNDPAMCSKARAAVVDAIDTEQGGRWLAVGRNLGSYIIAADVLGLTDDGNPSSDGSKVNAWLTRFYTRTLQANNDPSTQHTWRQSSWASGSNASAEEGFAYAALSAYLNKTDGLQWSWTAFRRYAGDRTSTHTITSNDTSWQVNPNDIVGIQDKGATKGGCRIDGAIANDMSRGGSYSCTPGYTSYPWVGLEGAVPAALVLHRAGFPAFEVSGKAILRTHEYLWDVRQRTGNTAWFDGTRSNEVIHLVNAYYKTNFLINTPVAGNGRTVDFTAWTHPSL